MSKVFLIYKSEKKAVGIAKPATLFVLLLLLCSGCVRTSWAAREPALPPLYAHWLNDEVKYLITNEERAAFLQQKTDADRDKFIEKFWLGRNPDPNAPMNKVKEDHYARLAYANEHFGRCV